MIRTIAFGLFVCLYIGSAHAEQNSGVIELGRAIASVEDCKEISQSLTTLVESKEITTKEAQDQLVEHGCHVDAKKTRSL
jgi:hypothetical protein